MSGWSELAGNREMLAKGKWRRQICVRHIKPQRRRESTNRRVVQRGKGSPKSVGPFPFLVNSGRGGSVPLVADIVGRARREMLALTTLGDAMRRI
jgi:hypothetical protein